METDRTTDPDDAARALAEIADAQQRAEAIPAAPPRWYATWYGALISTFPIAGGLLGAGQHIAGSAVSLLCVIGLSLLIGIDRGTRQARRRVGPDHRTLLVTGAATIVIVGSYALAWLATARWHLAWPAIVLAAATAVAGIGLVRSKAR